MEHMPTPEEFEIMADLTLKIAYRFREDAEECRKSLERWERDLVSEAQVLERLDDPVLQGEDLGV